MWTRGELRPTIITRFEARDRLGMMEKSVRVRDLKAVLGEVRGIFTASGARAQDKAFADLAEAMSPFEDEPAAEYLARVHGQAEAASAPPEERYSRSLADADLDEAKFLAALDVLRADKKLKKPALQKVVKTYTGSVDRRASAGQLVDAIKLAFYKKLYERDSRQLARKATPV